MTVTVVGTLDDDVTLLKILLVVYMEFICPLWKACFLVKHEKEDGKNEFSMFNR